jgi:hypothetical protein
VIEQPRLLIDMQRVAAADGRKGRRARAGDAADLDRLYAATYGQATGAWARSVPFWERRIAGVPKLWSRRLRFEVAGGEEARAYAAYEEAEGAGTVHELACAPGDEAVARDLLKALLSRWRQSGALAAELTLSSSHPLRTAVDDLVAEDRTGWDVVFIRVHDEATFLRETTALLQARAQAAGLALKVEGEGDNAVLRVAEGEPLQVGLTELATLIYNGRLAATHEALAAQMVQRRWTESLFPDTGAARCGLDGY